MAILKYKDPTTGDWIELSNAVGDTLPIGTIVDYDGTEVPPNWEKVGESGGGTEDGNEVEVTDTEPIDATVDLWVDTSEEDEFFQVVDDLTSDSSTNALSAKQGKVLNEKITNLTTYSTEEVKTGEIWIDGKPIYKKTIQFTTSATGKHSIKHNISDLDTIVDGKGSSKSSIGTFYIFPTSCAVDNVSAYSISIQDINTTYLYFFRGTSITGTVISYITLYYTKTTD